MLSFNEGNQVRWASRYRGGQGKLAKKIGSISTIAAGDRESIFFLCTVGCMLVIITLALCVLEPVEEGLGEVQKLLFALAGVFLLLSPGQGGVLSQDVQVIPANGRVGG